ncbi:hypothetical protein TGPRC2_314490 [Toxoplasma gondii TgCatPRC2]|uniref:Uncharacterized protein n=13 Tax=Toxoplasma gondii TaxID=5811 RepID=B9PIW3_TOXGV|nr:hypothetical protein TGME49_314490 [Toxoplasma gondii ME49]EPR61185.1 hypothetical protein TGGT1_314490 [Toxoplasma gondii GT1]ESS35218.1 hypothetical protein TGVEG_314490 [Toxoplasma gondii VEG]KAF4639583.1 hypothetical protein TGRH88_053550 [Toxoplasma gondii]KFG37643.1 hypothetical protein TGDOM2_314490 [Toxoplasma gondii GAB2-2007-GAL-DOM2]KFG49830.1 hypothetical protein TGP89_314490 [Toxoplasma gondii p89]KFG56243.1 hypothetical protein TGFOU_314490 [Toxoplasma gondii FOU]KFG66239.1 |eukprot:XP_002364649.1 hypothetical protein TGME49_314490 [Toxoplasma gondii ME49]
MIVFVNERNKQIRHRAKNSRNEYQAIINVAFPQHAKVFFGRPLHLLVRRIRDTRLIAKDDIPEKGMYAQKSAPARTFLCIARNTPPGAGCVTPTKKSGTTTLDSDSRLWTRD